MNFPIWTLNGLEKNRMRLKRVPVPRTDNSTEYIIIAEINSIRHRTGIFVQVQKINFSFNIKKIEKYSVRIRSLIIDINLK